MKVLLAAIALIAAGLGFWWFAASQENFKMFALIGFILMICALGLLLQHAGKLEETLKGWSKHGLPATGFVVSLAVAAWLAHDAYLDGLTWWKELHVLGAFFVAFLFGLATVGMLKGFLELCGKGIASFFGMIGKILAFKHGPFIAMVFWALILIGGGVTFFSMSKMELLEDFEGLPQVVFDIMKLVIAIGLFLIVFSPLAFMGKKK